MSQEICNNAIDDDGDFLIDLNDDDCICNLLQISSLIPNPSFESRNCCPERKEQLNCADNWIQASAATSDYIHSCSDFRGNENASAPLPYPDGDGIVGFRSGTNNTEYVGACLNDKMKVGTTYRLDFFLGFQDNRTGATATNISLYASTSCNNLPFGNANTFDCPLNYNDYDQLDVQDISGSNEWVQVSFEFTPTKSYEVFVLGSSCTVHSSAIRSSYFFLDNLILAESSLFGIPFDSITGRLCDNNLELQLSYPSALFYQWYLDGIALIGETNSTLQLGADTNEEGLYQALINTPEGCLLSTEYELKLPPDSTQEEATICEGEFILFAGDTLRTQNLYEKIVSASDGCDSLLQFDLTVLNNSTTTIVDQFCDGELESYLYTVTESGTYDLFITGSGSTDAFPKTYDIVLANEVGCDSIISLSLTPYPISSGIEVQNIYNVNLGENITITPTILDSSIESGYWIDDAGVIISEFSFLDNYLVSQQSRLYFEATDQYGCSFRDTVALFIDRSNAYVYIPNVFNPEAPFPNNSFRIFGNETFEQILNFSIYDRWGDLILEDKNITDLNGYLGWDGKINGTDASTGVYAYRIKVKYIDSVELEYIGSMTLVR